jgi:hypothetical protein
MNDKDLEKYIDRCGDWHSSVIFTELLARIQNLQDSIKKLKEKK